MTASRFASHEKKIPDATAVVTTSDAETPRGDRKGLKKYIKYDLLSGFLVFLIALPLCLGIAVASGYPPIAGVFTAIIGGIVSTIVSNSELTIKGPAAGLIPVAIGCVTEFTAQTNGDAIQAYRMALAVGVAAAVIQILFAVFRSGILGEFFPTSAVKGMLAAIGIIIIAKEFPFVLGIVGDRAKGDAVTLLGRVPEFLQTMNPEIAIIGVVSLILLFGLPLITNRFVRMIPAPMIVLLISVPLGMAFKLSEPHGYTMAGHQYTIGDKLLVDVPTNMFSAITHPDFSALAQSIAWKWVIMFSLIGSVESLLCAKAIDLVDPWKRKTNLNRDMMAIGIGNLLSAVVGGLPMISEIVRSRANIDDGARTRFADLYHGLFLLVFVWTIPGLIHQIPLAALGAMLIYTGYRLAHPREFKHMWQIGREQLVVYVTTILVTMATDLLKGVAAGVATEFAIHMINGMPLRSLFRPKLEFEFNGNDACLVRCHRSAVFTNWIPFKLQLERVGLSQKRNTVVDLSGTRLVDHTVMQKLHDLARDFHDQGLELRLTGLDGHRSFSNHPHSARKRSH